MPKKELSYRHKKRSNLIGPFLAEREGLWPNFCSVLTLFICASNCE